MLRRITDDDPRPVSAVNPEIPNWLEAIIVKLLAKNPDERFQSADEVAELLGQHLAHLQHPTTHASLVMPAVDEKPDTFSLADELGFVETSLRVYGVLAMVWALFALAFSSLVFGFPGKYEATLFKLNAPWALLSGVLSLVTGVLALIGTWHVSRRVSYRWAVAGNIASLLPVNPFVIMAVPWSFASIGKLRHPKVREAFLPVSVAQSSRPRLVTGLALAGALLLVAAAGVVIFVRTNYGTIRVEASDPNTVVTVDGQMRIVLRNSDTTTLTVRAGEHVLHIKQGDLEFETDRFLVRRGEKVVVRVDQVEGKLGARLIRPESP
jgi:hypothetical protein